MNFFNTKCSISISSDRFFNSLRCYNIKLKMDLNTSIISRQRGWIPAPNKICLLMLNHAMHHSKIAQFNSITILYRMMKFQDSKYSTVTIETNFYSVVSYTSILIMKLLQLLTSNIWSILFTLLYVFNNIQLNLTPKQIGIYCILLLL